MVLWSSNYSRRLFLWLATYSLLLVGCIVAFQYQRERRFKADELNVQLQLINNYIARELEDGTPMAQMKLHELHRFPDLRVSIIDSTGTLVYDNTLDHPPSGNHLQREEIAEALLHGSGYTVRRHSESTGQNYFYSALASDDGSLIVRTAVPYSVSLSSFLRADYGFLWFMALLTLAGCTLGFFVTRRLGQLISRLNQFARKAERGERIIDTEPFPHDELGDISNHIVRLYARLQKANADLDREHRAALHEQQEKDRIKKQLTNNINHELKTPVASIQVCLETLREHPDLAPDKRQDFIRRCLDNTDRLRRLLTDVSLITRMDDGSAQITKEPVDLSSIIAEVVSDAELVASSRGIAIDNRVAGVIAMNGNPSLLASVFRNLIDNAIAYSGGTRIEIASNIEHSRLTITVTDDGVGIPREHLSRIFERFYRIDKGRSRQAGGTGLGLSIVKNAILIHEGSITASNIQPRGLRFTITLPL